MKRIRRITSARESGVALMTVLMVVAVTAALGLTATAMTVSNTRNATFDRQGGVAQNVSEAGVAQAVAWIRYYGVGTLSCSPSCNPANGQPDWGQGPNVNGAGPNTTIAANASYGHLVTLAGGQTFRVWIEKVAPFNPPTTKVGSYRVHSVGTFNGSGVATGVRSVTSDITVRPLMMPIGIFAHTVAAGGNGGIHYESLFSDSCIQGREKESFQGMDAYLGVPAAAHSSNYIVNGQNTQCTAANSIHATSACTLTTGSGSNTQDTSNDTDKAGGALTAGDGCYGHGQLNGQTWLKTSQEPDFATMAQTYGFQTGGLSNSDLDALRTAAQQQGFYFTNNNQIPAVLQATNAWQTYPHPVLFYDFKGTDVGDLVDLSDLKGYSRSFPLDSSQSGCLPMGAIVVVLRGNVRLNSNTVLAASVYAPGPSPNGQVTKANGTGQLIGTLYADSIDMTGTSDVFLDSCFLQNMSGGLFNVTATNYREVDR